MASGLAVSWWWDAGPGRQLALGIGIGLFWVAAVAVCGPRRSAGGLRGWASGVAELPRLLVTCLVVSWPLLGLYSVLGLEPAVAGALTTAIVLAASTGIGRALVRVTAHRDPALRQRALVLGSDRVARLLVDRMVQHDELALVPVGYLDADEAGPMSVPRLGDLDALADVVARARVDRVIIVFPRVGYDQLQAVLRVCRDGGVAVDVVPRLFECLNGISAVDDLGGIPIMSVEAPTLSAAHHATKRVLDVVVAGLALVVLLPLLLAIAASIRLDSPGPAVFRQRRWGRNGRYFTMLKFRSMHVGSRVEKGPEGLLAKSPQDQRITRVGRVLRRLSLDEVPQLVNVLRGDMSLVGPRPLVALEAESLNRDWHQRRADLRPGLTGLWQVTGRSGIAFDEMIRLDYQYVAGWSLARDVEILLRTVPVVVSGRGAC